jgi:hypothetical protein
MDGVKGFLTSKRAIGMIVGAVLMGLAAFTPVEIDDALRTKLIDGIFWLVATFVGGTSLSDAFGKGKEAEKNRAKLAELIGTGLEVAADVASDLKKDEAPTDGGAES